MDYGSISRESVVVVGASLAGIRAAQRLRRDGFAGRLTLVGDEPHEPYDRPPLSKQLLAGEWDAGRTALVAADKLAELELDLRLGVRATALDQQARTVALDDGSNVGYDGLLIATGARARSLPGAGELTGVHVLRTLDDCLALRADLEAQPARVVVIGAGFIGAEVAATARERGLEVTMLEGLPQPMGRVLGDELGALMAEIHRERGVDVRCGVQVEALLGTDRVSGVRLADGTTIDAEVVVIGIGVIPNTEWLEGSGLTIDDGVVCDATCLAAPDITAAGDVARWPNELFGETMRVEHWDNAVEQGAVAARRLFVSETEAEPFTPAPWFWSDQFDCKIQLAGRAGPDDDAELITGSVEERRFAILYGRAGRLVGVFGMNRPRHVMQYRTRIAEGMSFPDALAIARDAS
ncbi:MAG: FAD-dependent oxidoreductase [Acidimicrobiales bacterium]|nr:FAD-dependent oxidoreductase [Acidimicrobiales bacterium]